MLPKMVQYSKVCAFCFIVVMGWLVGFHFEYYLLILKIISFFLKTSLKKKQVLSRGGKVTFLSLTITLKLVVVLKQANKKPFDCAQNTLTFLFKNYCKDDLSKATYFMFSRLFVELTRFRFCLICYPENCKFKNNFYLDQKQLVV